MTKRKRDAEDEESAILEQRKKVKKQKTSKITISQAKDLLNAAPNHLESGRSTQLPPKSEIDKEARRLAKRERRVLGKSQRVKLERKDELRTGQDGEDTQLVKKRGTQSLGKGHSSAAPDRHKSQEREKEGGQTLKRKHKSKEEKRTTLNVQPNGKKSKEKDVETAPWKVSKPLGGQMLDVDPVFSPDEKFLLIAYGTSIAVYSTWTSLLVRHLRIQKADSISAFAFSSTTQSHLYLATIAGNIEKWDWNEGLMLNHWELPLSIYHLVTAKPTPGDPVSDLVYTIGRQEKGPWLLSVHHLADGDDSKKNDVKTLLTTQQALSSVKVLENGRAIIATSGSQLMIGSSDEPTQFQLNDISYRWRIIECPEFIVSMDIRIRPSEKTQKMSKGGSSMANPTDIVVGGLKGSIHIYEDLLRKIIEIDHRSGKGSSIDISSRRLHWHRNAVLAVKWSADGNYIISGGQETTLVLWQLETEHRQHLPHLGAAVESIVVSPSGSSYAIRLADNSAMILSTSELQPTFSIAGIQIPAVQQARLQLPFVPTVTAPTEKEGLLQRSRCPACACLTNPGRLLLAVPPATMSRQLSLTPPKISYLQTFEVEAAHQISRQALTRTKVTILSMGPESNIVEEPNVTHIQTSSDGQWLASVDEWMPPKRDVEPLAFDQEKVLAELVFREEIYLKFWSWNEDTKMWELISRIDDPHASPSGNHYHQGGVLDLVSDPSSIAFATVGEDSIVKLWKPAVRRRNGLEVKSKDGRSLTAWHCHHTTPLETFELVIDNGILGAKLAYSQDGSILAAGLQSSTASPIYIIDTYSGDIKSVHTGLYVGPLVGLGIVHKYLVMLSEELRVYDLVEDKLNYGIDLSSDGLSFETRLVQSHLAIDAHNSLFAIAIPQITKTDLGSRVVVFDPTDATPQFVAQLLNPVTTLLSASEGKGFFAIDTAAQVQTIKPSQSVPTVSISLAEVQPTPTRGIKDLFGDGQRMLSRGDTSEDAGLPLARFDNVTHEPRFENDEEVVVSQDRLAKVFEVGWTYPLPPVTELFEQIASLYSGKVQG